MARLVDARRLLGLLFAAFPALGVEPSAVLAVDHLVVFAALKLLAVQRNAFDRVGGIACFARGDGIAVKFDVRPSEVARIHDLEPCLIRRHAVILASLGCFDDHPILTDFFAVEMGKLLPFARFLILDLVVIDDEIPAHFELASKTRTDNGLEILRHAPRKEEIRFALRIA